MERVQLCRTSTRRSVKPFLSAKGKSIFIRKCHGASSATLNEDTKKCPQATNKPDWIPFSHAKHGTFYQEQPKLQNQFISDLPLQRYIKRILPASILSEITPDLTRFGHRVATDINELARECEVNLPKLVPQNAWGERVDQLWTCEAWKQMHNFSAEEGIIAIAYEREYAEWSRLYQLIKLYLYAPSAGLYTCPLAMTDGATRSIEVLGLSQTTLNKAYRNLISRDPKQFWTSGQWMTEKRGGSDVAGGTETYAIPQPDGSYRLYGYKWFSSATDANMSLTLARVADEKGNFIQGTKGISLFYLETKNQNGSLNNFQMIRLKEKLGTRQVPTAELLLDGAIAQKISEDGRGVPGISTMLSLTRTHNAVASASGMRRMISASRDYAHRRLAFGKPIAKYPLHIQTLSRMDCEARAATLLILEIGISMGMQDCNKSTDRENMLLRLLTPIAKLYTAKQAVAVISEGLESFGGLGYMEDTGIPTAFRDAQVLPIWEGTTNILSLDVLRVLLKTNGEALKVYYNDVVSRLKVSENSNDLKNATISVKKALANIIDFAQNHPDLLEVAARDFAYSLARSYMGMLLIESAAWKEAAATDIVSANRWCDMYDLSPVTTNHKKGHYSKDAVKHNYDMVMENYEKF